MSDTKASIEKEIEEIKDAISSIEHEGMRSGSSPDGRSVPDADPSAALPEYQKRLADAEARLQRQISREAYQKASGA